MRPAGFTVMVAEPPGPGAIPVGKALTEIQLSAAETEVIASVPPPPLAMLRAAEVDCGFELSAVNESNGVPRVNCGGAAVTVKETVIVCDLPAHADDVQLTVTVPEYGDPVELSARAALLSPTETLPGVLVEPPTLIQGADADAVKLMACETTLGETAIVLGDGAAVVPAAIANVAVPEDRTRSGALGLIVPVIGCVAWTGGVAESVTARANAKSAATVGVPPISPPSDARPAGSEPVMLKI